MPRREPGQKEYSSMANLLRKSHPKSKPRTRKFPERHYYFVADGRDAAGIIELSGGYFVVYDPDGNILGKFLVAVRALPPRRQA
jgi:hypothetical protein